MAALTISDNDGTVSYTVGGTPSTGPYTIDFPFFFTTELTVTKIASGVETTLVLTTDYSVSGVAADDGYSSGSITLVAPASNCQIVIARTLASTKATNFPTSGALSIRAMNTLFSRLFSWAQDLRRKNGLALRFPAGDESINSQASPVATRKGKVAAYHGTTGALIESTMTLSAIESGATTAAASAVAAAASQSAAAASQSAAAVSESAAAASAAAAVISAGSLSPSANITWTGTNSHAGAETFTGNVSVLDSKLIIKDDADTTKAIKFQVSGVTAGQTRVLTPPNFDGTLATLAGTETLTNKTLEASSNSLGIPLVAQGRLTLTTVTPVLTSSVLGATTIYYTPYVGSFVPVYDGASFKMLSFSELSNVTTESSSGKAGPAAVTTNSNYDLFVWSDAGTIRLTRGPAWTSDTGRGTGAGTTQISRVLGIWTNTVAITNGPGAGLGTYVGTVRSDGSSQINWQPGATAAGGLAAVLGVWNAYNRVAVANTFGDSTASWVYNTAAWRSADNSTGLRVSYVMGLAENPISVSYTVSINSDTGNAGGSVGIGYNSTSAKTGTSSAIWTFGSQGGNGTAFYSVAALGFNYAQALEYSTGAAGNTYFYGSGGPWGPSQNGINYRGMF